MPSATINASTTAAALAKGGDADATAATFTVTAVVPKRISARLSLQIEDIAAVGQANFESILRENLSLTLSDELDDQIINGNGTAPNLTGMFARLSAPVAPGAAVATFDDFVGRFAGGIDGLWASTMSEVAIVCGPDSYKLAAQTFRDRIIDTGQRGGVSLGRYLFRRLCDGEIRRLLDEQANAGHRHQHSGRHPLPQGPQHDGRRRGDENRRLPALERGVYRRYLFGQRQRHAAFHDACSARAT